MELVMLLNALRKEGLYQCKQVGMLKIKFLSELNRQLWMLSWWNTSNKNNNNIPNLIYEELVPHYDLKTKLPNLEWGSSSSLLSSHHFSRQYWARWPEVGRRSWGNFDSACHCSFSAHCRATAEDERGRFQGVRSATHFLYSALQTATLPSLHHH